MVKRDAFMCNMSLIDCVSHVQHLIKTGRYQNPLADPHTSRMRDGMALLIKFRTSLRKRVVSIFVALNIRRDYKVRASNLACAPHVLLLFTRF